MSAAERTTAIRSMEERHRIEWFQSLPFFAMHAACAAAFWTGVSWKALALCAGTYAIRMFGITGGYHRYFSHRSYRTGRAFQFVLAWIGCSAAQKGPLWWAAHHRHHHRHSDRAADVHSPDQEGFWWSHVGWVLSRDYNETDLDAIRDFAKYPELRWLNRFHPVPPTVLGLACLLALGWEGAVWGFCISTVVLYHATFVINSLCHMIGRVRYPTADESRNSLILALITMGEGWHNNHHYYAASARMGFFWWEIDLSYYTLKVLAAAGLIWDLKTPPARVLEAASAATPARA